MKFYTGIGSRHIPNDIKRKFILLGEALGNLGFVLRSGAANGSDTAFEIGCDNVSGQKEIYLPWQNFNRHQSQLFYISPEALELAEHYYGSRWQYLKPPVKELMARNMYQVTGKDLDRPSEFVVCYTKDGCNNWNDRSIDTGGTGQAISYASDIGIPVFNLNNIEDEEALLNLLETKYNK